MVNFVSTYNWIFSVIPEACPRGRAFFILAQDPNGIGYRYIKTWATLEEGDIHTEIADAERAAVAMRAAGYINLDHWRVL